MAAGVKPGGNSFDTVVEFLMSHPVPVVTALAVTVFLLAIYPKYVQQQTLQGNPTRAVSAILKEHYVLTWKDSTSAVFTRPAWSRGYTWRTNGNVAVALTLIALTVGPSVLPLVPLVFVAAAGISTLATAVIHNRKLLAKRTQVTMQMFEVAAAECRYPREATLAPSAWIAITSWENLVTPGPTYVHFPPKYRSEDPRARAAFETNFTGTVSADHTWTYEWESAYNRVLCRPTPFIPTVAPYPGVDTHPWSEFPLGVGAGGKIVTWASGQFPHLLVAGATGSGKSVTQRTILMHAFQSPMWRILLADPKRVELSPYKDYPNVIRVETELAEMVDMVEKLSAEMDYRYKAMETDGVNFFLNMSEPPPALLLMVDEVYALLAPSKIRSDEGKEMDAQKDRCNTLIGNIARLGRAAGIHMVLCTQRPDAVVLPGETKANLDCRIAQGRMDTIPSQMTLDSDAATRIPTVKGRAVARQGNTFEEFQAYFLEPDQIPVVLAAAALNPTDSQLELQDAVRAASSQHLVGGLGGGKQREKVGVVSRWVGHRKLVVAQRENARRQFAAGNRKKPDTGGQVGLVRGLFRGRTLKKLVHPTVEPAAPTITLPGELPPGVTQTGGVGLGESTNLRVASNVSAPQNVDGAEGLGEQVAAARHQTHQEGEGGGFVDDEPELDEDLATSSAMFDLLDHLVNLPSSPAVVPLGAENDYVPVVGGWGIFETRPVPQTKEWA